MQTITNFRDLAGLENRTGQKIKPKKMLRSGELSRVSANDQERLVHEYRLAKIIDLRSQAEVLKRPDLPIANTDYTHIDIFQNIHSTGSGLDDFTKLEDPKQAQQHMLELYRMMAISPVAQQGFTQVIEQALSVTEQNSFLFHCFAGKDRTGLSATLLLELLDVPRTSIYEDYLRTNVLRQQENQAIIQSVIGQTNQPQAVEALTIALTVTPAYLDVFYQTVTEHYGNIEHFITSELQISHTMKQELQQLFLE